MNLNTSTILADCIAASLEERMTFLQVVGTLDSACVERYHTDLCRGENIYYFSNGSSELLPTGKKAEKPAENFSAVGVESAVRATQLGQIRYNEFCRRLLESGCVGWHVSILGKRVVYYGRTWETHVEQFPTKP